MEINTRRGFFGKVAAIAAVVAGGSKIAAAQQPLTAPAPAADTRRERFAAAE